MGLILALAGALQDSCRAQGTTEQRRCGQTSILGVLGLPQCRHTAPAAWPIGFHCICGLGTHMFCTALVSSCEPGKNICFQKKIRAFIGREKRKLKSGRHFVHIPFPTAVICFSSHNTLLCSMLLLSPLTTHCPPGLPHCPSSLPTLVCAPFLDGSTGLAEGLT